MIQSGPKSQVNPFPSKNFDSLSNGPLMILIYFKQARHLVVPASERIEDIS